MTEDDRLVVTIIAMTIHMGTTMMNIAIIGVEVGVEVVIDTEGGVVTDGTRAVDLGIEDVGVLMIM